MLGTGTGNVQTVAAVFNWTRQFIWRWRFRIAEKYSRKSDSKSTDIVG